MTKTLALTVEPDGEVRTFAAVGFDYDDMPALEDLARHLVAAYAGDLVAGAAQDVVVEYHRA